jgi:uncharacterized protein (DUF2141 family)
MKKFLLLLSFTWMLTSAWSQTLNVTITGIRNTKGVIRLQFYSSSQNFDDRKPSLVKTISKSDMKNGTLTVTYSGLDTGLYGIALLDDENNNKEMDYGVMLPDEGFGFSDYYHKGMSHPKFGQFDFYLKKETKNIKIHVRYM